jgi:hypothetical protein
MARSRKKVYPIRTSTPFGTHVTKFPSFLIDNGVDSGETFNRRSPSAESKRSGEEDREPKVIQANPTLRMIDFGNDDWLTGAFRITEDNLCPDCNLYKPVSGTCC